MPPREHDAAAFDDIPADGMLGVKAGEQNVLLTRVGSTVYAVGGTCPHAGGPLVEGVRQNDHVICPWHKASFCLRTGALSILRRWTHCPASRRELRKAGYW